MQMRHLILIATAVLSVIYLETDMQFQSSTRPVIPKPTILIDSNEQQPWEFTLLPTVRASLSFGDYAISASGRVDDPLVLIARVERKNREDAIGSIANYHQAKQQGTSEKGRIIRTLQGLRGFPHRLLVLEADASWIASGDWHSDKIKPNHVWGTLASWCVAYDIPVWCGSNPACCAAFVERWFNQVARHVCARYAAAADCVRGLDG